MKKVIEAKDLRMDKCPQAETGDNEKAFSGRRPVGGVTTGFTVQSKVNRI